MNDQTDGIRECLFCHKSFVAIYPAQVTCSEECKKIRRKKLQALSAGNRREAPWLDAEWLNCQLEDALEKNKTAQSAAPQASDIREPFITSDAQAEAKGAPETMEPKLEIALETAACEATEAKEPKLETTQEIESQETAPQEKKPQVKTIVTEGEKTKKPKVKLEDKICPKCGESFTPKHFNQIYCSPQCKEIMPHCSRPQKKPSSGKRVCHDCGKPTTNYRCDECWAKLRRRNGLAIADTDEEMAI